MSYNSDMNTKFIRSTSFCGVTFRYSRGRSLASGKELHPHHEVLYYLGGDAEFLSAEYRHKPECGTLFVIPKEHFHNFRIGDEDNYTRLTFAFGDAALPPPLEKCFDGIRVITPSGEPRRLLDAMCERMDTDYASEATPSFMYGAFLMLISLLSESDVVGEPCKADSPITVCLGFIDSHFAEPLPVSRLCAECHTSESALLRLFRSELGISPHKYITERRLIEANKLIAEGRPAAVSAALSGFTDYSAFYKAYIKKFGVPPSHTLRGV